MNPEIGDVVEYRDGRRVEIESFGEKDGRALFDGTVVSSGRRDNMSEGDGAWGYISQIKKVE